ncbi:MAG: 2-amino-4-hydroxy-6-hydroxymethyldihydropteridine diphosphokinase [Cytophagaceae bacterium]|nr:2-amino-4-hydroxy-6-hydroxymethyldihydropteridine diphosphokinase [Cytophagaceae bacterium]MDW8455706.1 2-amino-4-hydroxy-6-hydroxymethyldihydropteridine diphosphokinase [Cytophagaceae bacterium]
MNTAYLLLGSNIGDRKKYLSQALNHIESAVGKIIKTSSVYESTAWGKEEQRAFLNQVVFVQTLLSPEEILNTCLQIESNMGRIRIDKWGERIIDIDILYFNTAVVKSDELMIPHPYIADRKFTLVPLCEIAPDYIHPVLMCTNCQLLYMCKDNGHVSLYEN